MRQPFRHKRIEPCVTHSLQHASAPMYYLSRKTIDQKPILTLPFFILSSLTVTVAADSSNRGIIILFRGKTLALHITNVQ